jgi:hypothetical protein
LFLNDAIGGGRAQVVRARADKAGAAGQKLAIYIKKEYERRRIKKAAAARIHNQKRVPKYSRVFSRSRFTKTTLITQPRFAHLGQTHSPAQYTHTHRQCTRSFYPIIIIFLKTIFFSLSLYLSHARSTKNC